MAVCPPGGPIQYQDMLIVSGSQIQDLKIVPTSTPQQHVAQQQPVATATSYPHHPHPTVSTPPNKVQETPITSTSTVATDATPKPMSSTSQTASKPAMSIVDPAIVHVSIMFDEFN